MIPARSDIRRLMPKATIPFGSGAQARRQWPTLNADFETLIDDNSNPNECPALRNLPQSPAPVGSSGCVGCDEPPDCMCRPKS